MKLQFKDLPVDFLEKMGHEASYVNFLPGDTVFYQGDKGDSLYIILSGQVQILIANAAGENELILDVQVFDIEKVKSGILRLL
ncbi:cyclic nucleotide-binding domain-containing protein [Bathymodiolus japonicus methanotrophic gill symbiont]|uniref:cyclic nucleotide-binding domain-containing protein n=1 Tax=Bathymodiolus japonicus methanotrophic gill symbiont TaxID=113269 RepID=UPI001C8DE587|nr:cyclic nucleotide-binding domain-containing protein [Bathymodiolus japonicus methanotrophic gill symbiont]